MSYSHLLAQVSIFEHLEREDLDILSAHLRTRRYAKGEVIFHQGDVGTAVYIIRKGEVAIRLSSWAGREIILSLLDRGDFFGELSLLDGAPRCTDAVAREETDLLSIQREDFHRFLVARPQVALRLLATLSGNVRQITQVVHDTTFLDARARLVRVLVDLARTQGDLGTESVVLSQKLTQTEVANLCGLTRESTNKWLRFYVREGLLAYEGGYITLVHPERLAQEIQ